MGISALLEDDEKENVEFKTSLSEIGEILKTISAFSNKRGGTILVGVTNDRNVVGVDIGRNTLERLANNIRRETDPQIFPSVGYSEQEGKTIISIEVSESTSKPVFYRDKAYIRVGRTNQKLSSTEIRNLITTEHRVTSWDEQVVTEASFEDIDGNKLTDFLKLAVLKRNLDLDPKSPIEEALSRLDLLRDGKLTNAAILLFGKNPQKFVLQAFTQCGKFKGVDTLEFEDMHDFKASIIDQRDDALRFAEKHIRRSARIEGSERVEEFEYPIESIREAITNAICHRDYRINSSVQIRIFDDRMEIWGCGPLPEPLTVEDLKNQHESIRRNPLIAEFFFKIGFIERWGTGTQRIIDFCLEQGLPEPLFEIKSGSLVVTLRKYKYTESMKRELSLRQQNAMEYLIKHGKITNREYREINPEIKEDAALNDLKDLVDKGLISLKARGRYSYYVLC
ncbi:AlbA family DNA-binding domain-containing protein [Methanobacterium formicicum]|uniref:Divergent AAA domain-containing protein n=1 Tax=Methanobacterium formicicum TaxID=2162 RepID=A0A089ZAR5_METFO|nr:helix-turn-helix domain-containing protein [Methanobacterium formicicum]AIS31117.1 divergent AAA domain-containing protein [Methanobacterium formicicum]CEL25721.1 putative transcriptional regulator [Methanobacterium formicicum]